MICSDKTGTLTRNEMTVRTLVLSSGRIEVEGAGYEPRGGFVRAGQPLDPAAEPVLEDLALAAVLCNDAGLVERDGTWAVDGDPMEGALVSLAIKAGHDAAAARAQFTVLDEVPFDSRHRYMATLNRRGSARIAYVKGAPERILAMCAFAATDRDARSIDAAHWTGAIEQLAQDGQRVLALARRSLRTKHGNSARGR